MDPRAETISDDEMRAFIAHLRPDRELFAGRKFFERLFEARGVEGVIAFVQKATIALDKQDGLDLHYDFDPQETRIFRSTPVNVMSRRYFLGTAASNASGAVFAATGLVGIVKQLRNTAPTEPEPKPADNVIDRTLATADKVTHAAYPTAELLIGAALIYEGGKNKFEEKLEQIADAVEELSERIDRAEAKRTR